MQNELCLKLLSDLVAFKSVTPQGDEAIDYCEKFLKKIGFECNKLRFGDVSNLYAKIGNSEKNLCFAGHVDVVPPLDCWTSDPFVLTERNGLLYGRGTNDMKGGLSAGLSAIAKFLTNNNPNFSISVILTSDEEVMGKNGTNKVVEWLKSNDEKITGCILCESCSPAKTGEYIKIGCRGSLNIDFNFQGKQCHVVNGSKYGNQLHKFIEFLTQFSNTKLDDGNKNFTTSDIEMTSVDVGNSVRNIIAGKASAKFSIRFNDMWDFDKLETFIIDELPKNVSVHFERCGLPFIGTNEDFIDFLSKSIKTTLKIAPEIGTAGGNSDAQSLHKITNVVEIGTPIENAHIVNEFIAKEELEKLFNIYNGILCNFDNWKL